MTYAVASFDFFDDGLVHAHQWSRATPPGQHHTEARRNGPTARQDREHDLASEHETRGLRK
jgi:hypothetical protein